MEDEERSPLAPSIKGNSGGSGQKRKRGEEQEKDPNSRRIVMSHRLAMLDSIVCVLKCSNSVLRFHVPADGDLGFRLETGSLEEQRIAGLIYSHVCSYILLYHIEKKKTTNADPSPIEEADELAGEGEVTSVLWDVGYMEHDFVQPLIDGRRALVEDHGNRGAIEVSSTFDELRDYNKGRRKQELLDALHTLEIIGHARCYAPPEDDEEIMCYKEIRKQISWYILHVQARNQFLVATGEKPCNHPILSDPFTCPPAQEALCFIPPLHQLEVSFEQMPEHLSLLKECRQRVTHLLSATPTPMPDRIHDLAATMRAKDASRSALISWEPNQESYVTTRSDCLDGIIRIFRRIKPFDEQALTVKDVRMYALIGEHVRSSIWLSHSIPYIQRIDKASCVVYFANASLEHDHSLLSKSNVHATHGSTREQLLEQIVAYLRAFKASCMDDVPSWEEENKYRTIWMTLYPGLLVCLRSRHIGRVDEEPEEMPELELQVLNGKLSYIYKRVLRFIGEVKEEILSVAAVVHRALRPEEQLSAEDAMDWFMTCQDDAKAKAKEFVDRSRSLGSMSKLEHALLVLVELGAAGLYFFRLSEAVDIVEWAWHDEKKYSMVASEVENAFGVICSEKPLVK